MSTLVRKRNIVRKQDGVLLAPVPVALQHERMLLWCMGIAEQLITDHDIPAERAILSALSQAEAKFHCQWVYGPVELQKIAAGGLALVYEYATKAKYLRGLDD